MRQPMGSLLATPWSRHDDGLRLLIQVQPGGGQTAIEGVRSMADGRSVLRVRVSAAPEGGKANQALIKLLAKQLGLAKGDITILSGRTARLKSLQLAGRPEALIARLRPFVEAK